MSLSLLLVLLCLACWFWCLLFFIVVCFDFVCVFCFAFGMCLFCVADFDYDVLVVLRCLIFGCVFGFWWVLVRYSFVIFEGWIILFYILFVSCFGCFSLLWIAWFWMLLCLFWFCMFACNLMFSLMWIAWLCCTRGFDVCGLWFIWVLGLIWDDFFGFWLLLCFSFVTGFIDV